MNDNVLDGQLVCATGRLVSMTHAELAEVVRAYGGTFVKSLKRCGHTVVIGADGWPAENDGNPTQIFRRARELQICGYPIEFTTEDRFLERLELTQPAGAIRSQHTIADLSRILDVSAVRIRRWIHAGLVQSVESTYRLARFDFDQVANAKRLSELLEKGVSLAAIRKGIDELRQWLPDERLPLSQIAMLEQGRVVLRFHGELIEGSGQRLFEFETDENAPLELTQPQESGNVDLLFETALELEDNGHLNEAADIYRKAIQIESGDPILHFNLGNVEYAQSHFEAAVRSFRAALECDAQYSEAWNNLGSALSELQQWDHALDAFQQAVKLVPSYSDAHYNLGDVLKQLGRNDEADEHLRLYRQFSSSDHLMAERTTILRIVRGIDSNS